MYHILVPVDDDVERATEQANYIRDLPGSPDQIRVTILHAYDDTVSAGEDSPSEEIASVRKTRDRLEESGIETESKEIFLPVTEGIVDAADEMNPDNIVMAGRKRSPTGKAVFGSISQQVILTADHPVTIVTD